MPLTTEEKARVNNLREKLGNDIPEDLNTDFNLLRWSHACKGNADEIFRLFWDYVESRHAVGFDTPDFIDKHLDLEVRRKYVNFYSFMTFSKTFVNKKDNCILLLMRLEGFDIKSIMKKYPMSQELMAYFSINELYLQRMLRLEAATGKPSGKVFVLDIKGIHLAEFIDPRGPCAKFAKLQIKVWNTFYYELVSKMYIINASSFLSAAFQLVKFLLPSYMHNRVFFLQHPEDLANHLDPDIVPVGYGGNFKDTSDWSDNDYCCNVPIPIHSSEFYEVGTIWKTFEVEQPELQRESIKPHKKFIIEKDIEEKGVKMAWQFWANGEIEFGIVKVAENSKPTLVFPRLTTTTVSLPEEGSLICEEAAKYRFEFKNNSSFFSLSNWTMLFWKCDFFHF